jgi:hypothetical protein
MERLEVADACNPHGRMIGQIETQKVQKSSQK